MVKFEVVATSSTRHLIGETDGLDHEAEDKFMSLTREFGIGIVWEDRRDDEDPDWAAVCIELGGNVVVGFVDEHFWAAKGRRSCVKRSATRMSSATQATKRTGSGWVQERV